MSFWKLNFDMYFSPVLREITAPTHTNDGFMLARESIFIRLLTYCANGNRFTDHAQFSRFTGSPIKQSKIVWDICLDKDILRKTGFDYSAIDWMVENDLIPQKESRKKAQKEEQPRQDKQPDVVVQPAQCEKAHPEPEPAKEQPKPKPIDDSKQYVRPNVTLSAREIEHLRNEFSDEEITYMVDVLSEYKRSSNRTYNSDYDAIKRWVVKNLRDHQKQKQQPSFQIEFPNWLTGGGNDKS